MSNRSCTDPTAVTQGWTRRRLLSCGLALAGVSAAGMGFTRRSRSAAQPAATPGALNDDLRVSTSGWTTDFTKHSVSLSEFQAG
ncbi:MAG: hypothetical protein M3R06_04690, partial [Chloroflexota bacterium]|nr:hypothetical protein [Chloroflexota bacterium]